MTLCLSLASFFGADRVRMRVNQVIWPRAVVSVLVGVVEFETIAVQNNYLV